MSQPDVVTRPLFTTAKRLRSFDDVVSQIREAIFTGRLKKGDRLPNERDLCRIFGVGRSTLREALRTLEALGALESRIGAAGGVFVTEPGEQQLAQAFEALVRFRGASDREFVEFGVALVSETAYWAAVRADDLELEAIDRAAHRLATAGARGDLLQGELASLYSEFFEALARASRNRVRVALVLGMHRLLVGAGARSSEAVAADVPAVAEAVLARNARLARVRMRRHLLRLTTEAQTVAASSSTGT